LTHVNPKLYTKCPPGHVFFIVKQLHDYNCTWWCIDACKVQWLCITFCHTIPYCCYDDLYFLYMLNPWMVIIIKNIVIYTKHCYVHFFYHLLGINFNYFKFVKITPLHDDFPRWWLFNVLIFRLVLSPFF